jgi:hypothetical protein
MAQREVLSIFIAPARPVEFAVVVTADQGEVVEIGAPSAHPMM